MQLMPPEENRPFQLLQQVLEPGDQIRVIGSSLFRTNTRDIDIVVCNEALFAKLMFLKGQNPMLSPILMEEQAFNDIHNRMSFYQQCVAMKEDGRFVFGREYTTNKGICFNTESITTFRVYDRVTEAYRKLTQHGLQDDTAEFNRISLLDEARLQEAMYSHMVETIHPDVFNTIIRSNAVLAGGFFRDFILGKPPKDVDIFVLGGQQKWNGLCTQLGGLSGIKEMDFLSADQSTSGRVNVRKFLNRSGLTLDVIHYPFVQNPEHVVETFDFSVNMIWFDKETKVFKGSSQYDVKRIIDDIATRRINVGDNLWYRASPSPRRALERWERMVEAGFVADGTARDRYSDYIQQFFNGS